MTTLARPRWLSGMAAIAGFALFAGVPVSQAQTPPDAGRAAERIQREQQELQRQQLEQQRRDLPAPKQAAEAPEVDTSVADAEGPCRDIGSIDIGGSANLPAAERARITKSYAGRCLRVRDIEQLMADVTNAYISRGYITTRRSP
jgi:hemolysin activation/secretion protein